MTLTILTALDANNVMAVNKKLAYKVPTDLAFFKAYTYQKSVLVGRNTYEEVKDLASRDWILLDRETGLDTMKYCASSPQEVIVGGGRPIYKLAMGVAQKVIINRLQQTKQFSDYDLVTYFPDGMELMYKLVSVKRFVGFDQETYILQ